MPRPKANNPSNPSRSRVTAGSFPKPAAEALATPLPIEDDQPPVPPYPQPYSTPPCPTAEEFSAYQGSPYSQPPIFMPPPPFTDSSPYAPSRTPLNPGMLHPHSFPGEEYGPGPTGYPSHVYFAPPSPNPAYVYQNSDIAGGEEFVALPNPTQTVAVAQSKGSDSENSHKATTKGREHLARPANSWILYRSAKIKEIESGAEVAGLEEAQAELSIRKARKEEQARKEDELALKKAEAKAKAKGTPWPPKDGPSKEELPDSDSSSKSKSDAKAKPKAKKSKKKAGPEVAPGLLALGPGKTGRGPPQSDLSQLVSIMWRLESPEVKAEWAQKSLDEKNQLLEEHPDYVYHPRTAADKLQERLEKEKEKEARRQAKELERSGRRRRPRTRTRNSPTAPYSVLSPSADRTMARSLSYSGDAGSRFGQALNPQRTPDEKGGTIYPFPMPAHAIPSMPAAHSFETPHEPRALHPTLPQSISTPNLSSVAPHTPRTSYSQNDFPAGSMLGEHYSPANVSPLPPVVPRHAVDHSETDDWRGPSAEELANSWAVLDDGEFQAQASLVQDISNSSMQSSDHATSFELRQMIPPASYPPASWDNQFHDATTQYLAPPFVYDMSYGVSPEYPSAIPLGTSQIAAMVYPNDTSSMLPDSNSLWFDQVDLGNRDEPIVLTRNGDVNASIVLEAVVMSDVTASPGPLLSGNDVLSPSYLDWNYAGMDSNSSTSPSDSNDDGTYSFAPRHVSSSSFLVTPQTDSRGLPIMPFSDRTASFAFADAFMGGLDDNVGDDIINWGQEEDDYQSSRVVSGDTVIGRRSISVASGYSDTKRSRTTSQDVPTAVMNES